MEAKGTSRLAVEKEERKRMTFTLRLHNMGHKERWRERREMSEKKRKILWRKGWRYHIESCEETIPCRL